MPFEAIKNSVQQSYKRLNHQLADFVPRKEQNYLVAEIVKVLCGQYGVGKRILVAEAGTGIGKSLAYAQGAIPCALKSRKKLIISTATLALQEQLITKDLPLFHAISADHFTFTLVKGRQRYCCAQRLAQLASPASLDAQLSFQELLSFSPDAAQQQIYQQLWHAYESGSWAGDRDSWSQSLDDELWREISAERHICNPLFDHHQACPFHHARAQMNEMDVLVVNHALLLADLALGGGVVLPVPEDCIYVLDEAHHLPIIARDQASALIPLANTLSWLQKLPQIGDRLIKLVQGDATRSTSARLATTVYELIDDYRQIESLLKAQAAWFSETTEHRFVEGRLPDELSGLSHSLFEGSGKLIRLLERQQQALTEAIKLGEIPRRDGEALLAELGHALLRSHQMQALWLLYKEENAYKPVAKWITYDPQGPEYQLQAAPLEMGHWLDQMLWSRGSGAILVSATLTALNSFDHFRRQIGLYADDGSRYLRLLSPFDYQQAEIWVPTMDCDPGDPGFTQQLIQQLPLYLAEQQATLVLFASYWQMQEVAAGLREQGWSLLVQGEASRNALLLLHKERCLHGQPSILLGTGSFSEGLDLPGVQLTNLIITKLPFAVPTSPIEAAQAEWIISRGGNPFLQVTVPDASRKLIQACGRLIRKEGDAGRIVLLDRRIVTRRYGQGMLDALPPFRRRIDW
jgi:ATP-dependent DNA helicase DinG